MQKKEFWKDRFESKEREIQILPLTEKVTYLIYSYAF